MAIAWKATRNAFDNGVVRIDTVIPPDQDNLRNRYPEPVEGSPKSYHTGKSPTPKSWFDKSDYIVTLDLWSELTLSGIRKS